MHPILATLPNGAPVYAYGAMLGLSFAIGWYLTLGLGVRDGFARPRLMACFLASAVAAMVGARILFVVTNPASFQGFSSMFDGSGLVAYGGFLGGLAGAAIACRVTQVPLLAFADCAVPSLASGLLFTRIGCFLAGCDYGTPSDAWFAMRFPRGSFAFLAHRSAGLVPPGASTSLPVVPTQLIESLAGALLLVAVFAARRRRKARGEALVVFTVGYAALRFAIETVRADADRGLFGPFSTSQWLALATGLAAAVLGWRLRSRRSFLDAPDGTS